MKNDSLVIAVPFHGFLLSLLQTLTVLGKSLGFTEAIIVPGA